MKRLYIEQLEIIIRQMREYQSQHPKADVFYDVERDGIQIVYPLPKDFYELKKVEIRTDKGRKWKRDMDIDAAIGGDPADFMDN